MNYIEPINQTNLFGLDKFFLEFIRLYKRKKLPSKILLTGQKGLGKSTMVYHFINYALSIDEQFPYNIDNLKINENNHSFKTILNRSNPNFILINIDSEKKYIDINQIRNLISSLYKSSFNKKPRFVLIDNIEFLNINSINALLKILEEPLENIYFFLINNNKKILSTLTSRCINFNISLSNEENIEVANKILNKNFDKLINKEIINYYLTPGIIYNLATLDSDGKYDLADINLKEFLKIIIKDKIYKKNIFIKYLIYDLIEFYFNRISSSLSSQANIKYNHFLKKIANTKKFNLDEDSIFMEFEDEILNG